MRQQLLTALRRLVLTRVLKTLPMRDIQSLPAEPKRDTDTPETDAWIFEADRPVEAHLADISNDMGRLSGALGRLHALVGEISAAAPLPREAHMEPAAIGTVWSDTLLFDGEPAEFVEDSPLPAHGAADFLFEDERPVRAPEPAFALQAGLQLPLPAPQPSAAY